MGADKLQDRRTLRFTDAGRAALTNPQPSPLVGSRYPDPVTHLLASLPPSDLRSCMVDAVRAWQRASREILEIENGRGDLTDLEFDVSTAMALLIYAVAPAGSMTAASSAAEMAKWLEP